MGERLTVVLSCFGTSHDYFVAMAKPSLAGNFYDQILSYSAPEERFEFLKSLAAANTIETDWLEFKSGRSSEAPEDAIKGQWSKALSAFANTEGGVLIWGIEARKDASGVDRATGISPVKSAQAFRSRLDQILPTASDPPIPNVKLLCVQDPLNADQGFVVALIPESAFKPHRAEFAQNNFYLRTGSSSNPLRPGTLRHLFYANGRAVVVPVVKCFIREMPPMSLQFRPEFSVNLKNHGTQTANDLFVVVETLGNMSANGIEFESNPGYVGGSGFVSKRPLHPGARVCLGSSQVSEINCKREHGQYSVTRGPAEVKFLFRIYMRDQEPLVASCSFTQIEIANSAEKRAEALE